MSGTRSRDRGRRSETMVANYLREWWPDARRVLAGDGRQHCDVEFHPLVSLEVKAVSRGTSWPTWCRQAAAQAHPGTVPVVVWRHPHVTDPGLWPIRARLGEWVAAFGHDELEESYWYDRGDGTLRLWRAGTLADLVAAIRAVDAPVSAPTEEAGPVS